MVGKGTGRREGMLSMGLLCLVLVLFWANKTQSQKNAFIVISEKDNKENQFKKLCWVF